MNRLKTTLVADGSSDRALLPIIGWLLRASGVAHEQPVLADLRALPKPPEGLSARAQMAVRLHPCDVLVVHRDAEAMSWAIRREEIRQAVTELGVAYVGVVPVRMTEAWLLHDESALRRSAGNPNGPMDLLLPPLHRIESLVDAKKTLFELLKKASGFSGRRLASFRPQASVQNLSFEVADYAPLRALTAFAEFEAELQTFLGLWSGPSSK